MVLSFFSSIKLLFICPKKERIKLGLSRLLLRQAYYGNSYAQLEIASRYFSSNKKQYTNKSIYWFKLSAENDNKEAMFILGTLYFRGKATKKNLEEAILWYKKASLHGHKKAAKYLVMCELEQLAVDAAKGDRTAIKSYTDLCISHQVKINHYLLMDWLHQSAKLGDSQAMVDIGNFYAYGTPPLTKDYQQAIYWFNQASLLENNQAMNLLGQLYLNGHGVMTNKQTAIDWFTKASHLGNDNAMVNLANIYLEKSISLTDTDYQIVHKWLLRAADKNNLQAISLLIQLYKKGLGIPKDLEKVADWQQRLTQKNLL